MLFPFFKSICFFLIFLCLPNLISYFLSCFSLFPYFSLIFFLFLSFPLFFSLFLTISSCFSLLLQEQNRTHVPQISSLTAEISSQDHTKRLVRDNIDVRETGKAYQQLSAELLVLRGEEGAGGTELKDAQRFLRTKHTFLYSFLCFFLYFFIFVDFEIPDRLTSQ